jgi:glycosyltransferase involved in cell wall biosynthesis
MTDGLAIHDMVLPHGRSPLSIGEFVLFAFLQTALKAGSVDCMIMDPHLAPFLLPIVLIRRVTTHSPVLILRVPTNPVETGGLITTVYMKFLYQLSVRLGNVFFDKTLFISPMLRDYYRALSHVPSEKAGVWPTSVDLHVFDPNLYPDQTVEMLRKKLGVGNKVCLIYHGSLTRPRGIMELLKAMTLLKQGKQANVMLILVGYGPLREEIKRYIQSEGLHDTVILCDQLKRDEVAERIAMADVEVLPMPDHEWWRYQCFIKVLECLAMNKPLISYRLPAVEVIVGDMPVVYWLKGTEGRDIADGILGYLRTRGSLNPALGRKIASRYSAEVIAENLEADITERN